MMSLTRLLGIKCCFHNFERMKHQIFLTNGEQYCVTVSIFFPFPFLWVRAGNFFKVFCFEQFSFSVLSDSKVTDWFSHQRL